MSRRGALYVYWEPAKPHGAWSIKPFVDRAIASFAAHHPELPYHVAKLPAGSTLYDKATMFDHTPFDTTVFLDADTVVLGRLDYGFEMAERFGLACCHCVNPWLRRYVGVVGDWIEYNTGVLFFSAAARPLFDRWRALAPQLDSRASFIRDGFTMVSPRDDQLSFSRAVQESARPPFVLPYNWNFAPPHHHSFFGPLKVWHSYATVPETVLFLNQYYEQPGAIMQFHELTGIAPSLRFPEAQPG
ncbi:MAG: hypothetical protein HY060_24775 [Proteobacteria bacterium]|nr:hypothetical protein [Pseudomonadota bacterium]